MQTRNISSLKYLDRKVRIDVCKVVVETHLDNGKFDVNSYWTAGHAALVGGQRGKQR